MSVLNCTQGPQEEEGKDKVVDGNMGPVLPRVEVPTKQTPCLFQKGNPETCCSLANFEPQESIAWFWKETHRFCSQRLNIMSKRMQKFKFWESWKPLQGAARLLLFHVVPCSSWLSRLSAQIVHVMSCPCCPGSCIAIYDDLCHRVKYNIDVMQRKYARLVQPLIGSRFFGRDDRLTPAELAAKKAKQAEDASGAFEVQ